MAPVNAPFSWPNNSLSIRVSGKAAALIATKGPSPRGLHLWISRATNSFPVPLSPQINTGAEVGATCLMSEKICCIAGEVPYQVPEYAAKAQVALKLVGFLQASFVANRAFQKGLEGARFHRLLQEPECLEVMNGGQRLFHAAEAGERDRRSEVAAFLQMPEQLEAVHARHDQIRNDDVRVEGSEPFQRFLPVGRDLRFKVAVGKHGSQGGTLPLVIVNDEDPARNRRQSGHRLLF